MTFDEALSELGLESNTDSNVVRRAYLRKVKAHPPERDPDGFRRVRDAYDLLASTRTPPPSVVLTPVRPEPATLDAPIEAPDTLAMTAAHEVLASIDPESPKWAAITKQLIDEHPKSAWLHWQLVSNLDQRNRPRAAERAIVQALRAGHPEFLQPALYRCPEQLTLQEIEEATRFAGQTFNAAIHALLVRKRWVTAARALRSALEAALEGHAPPPDASGVVYVILVLRARKSRRAAARLEKRFVRWLSLQRSLDALGNKTVAWVLYQDIRKVRRELHPELFARLCGVLSEGEIEPMHPALEDFRRHYGEDAKRAVGVFQVSSMNLDRVFSPALTRPSRTSRERGNYEPVDRRAGSVWPVGLFIVVALSVFGRLCSAGSSSSKHDYQASVVDDRRPVTILADLAEQRYNPEMASAAAKLESALSRGNCLESSEALDELGRLDVGNRYPHIIRQSRIRVTELCPRVENPPPASGVDE